MRSVTEVEPLAGLLRRRIMRVRLSGVAALLALVACSGLSSSAELDACLEREAVGYSQVVNAARTVLADVGFRLTRVGACADTGRPWTRVQATVREWPDRRIANRYLARRGWSPGPGGFVSPDGTYRALASTARDADASETPYVTVVFVEVADEADWMAAQGSGD